MKTINLRSRLIGSSLALACLLGGMTVFALPTQAAPDGKSYDVKVTPSVGDTFTACFDFVAPNTLKIDIIPNTAVYGGPGKMWLAVTKPGLPVSVGFSGKVSDGFIPDQTLTGDAINSVGTTFNLQGQLKSEACPALRTTSQDSPFFK